MADPVTIVQLVVVAVAAGLGGGGIGSFVQMRLQARRERRLDIWESYKEQIKSAEARGDSAEVDRLRCEYESQQEAWRAQQRLERLAPREIPARRGQPSLAEDEVEQLRRLLAESQPLTPALLSADDHYLRGNAYYAADRYEEALAAYDLALRLRPDDPATLSERGSALGKLNRHEEALTAHNRALELRPNDAYVLNDRGLTLHYLARYDEALADHNRSLELRPDDPGTYYNRACLFALWGKPDDAIEDLRVAIERDPKHREMARTDADFDGIRGDPRFRALVGEHEPPAQADSP